MAIEDMKYSFTDKNGAEHTVEIPADVLRKGKRDGLSNKETILLHLANNGYMVDAPEIKKKKKVTRTRKADPQKQSIINVLVDAMEKQGNVKINVINAERQFQIELDDELYEVTLVKKRKPKN